MKHLLICSILLTYFAYVNSDGVTVTMENPNTRIVGGQPATLGEIYYQVSLQRKNSVSSNVYYHICGGSIISLTHVLTAAHCVYSNDNRPTVYNVNLFRLVSNTTNINNGTGQARAAIKIIPHKSYKHGKSFDNDIALIKLYSPFISASTLRPVVMRTGKTKTNEFCVISGYGSTYSGGPGVINLLRASVSIQDHSNCKKVYSSTYLTNNMICAGDTRYDACQGDSGGPIVCGNELAGIVSFGNECAKPNYPGVYTEVSKYTSWILKNNSIANKASVIGIALMSLVAYLL